MDKLKPCRLCGKRAIIENWSSGGPMYMAKCSNPDCEIGQEITNIAKGHNLPRVITEWNQMQDGGKYDFDRLRAGKDGT